MELNQEVTLRPKTLWNSGNFFYVNNAKNTSLRSQSPLSKAFWNCTETDRILLFLQNKKKSIYKIFIRKIFYLFVFLSFNGYYQFDISVLSIREQILEHNFSLVLPPIQARRDGGRFPVPGHLRRHWKTLIGSSKKYFFPWIRTLLFTPLLWCQLYHISSLVLTIFL